MITSLKNNKRSRVSTFEKIKKFKEGNKQKMKRNLILFGIGMGILIYFIGFVKF